MNRCKTKGFTLIELLVVIAIIGIMASMLLPAVSKAMRTAKERNKQTNLRSMYQANLMYALDNFDLICVVKESRNGLDLNWRNLLGRYIAKQTEKKSEANKEQIFIDPFFKEYDPDTPAYSGYAMNAQPGLPKITRNNAFWNENYNGMEFGLYQITVPFGRTFIGDAAEGWFYTQANLGQSLSADRHFVKGKPAGMYLMYDGSIRFLGRIDAEDAVVNPKEIR